MRFRIKAAGIAALAGFLAITAWSAVLVPPSCCAPACDACPLTVCSPSAAATPSRVELAAVEETLSPVARSLPMRLAPADLWSSVPAFAFHAFRRPMRN